jgi:hypothetical protein
MRSLQHGLGKRSPLFFSFTGGVNLSGFSPTVFDFNKTPVAPPTTLTSSAAAPINTPAAFFTTGDDPNTAYSFDNSVSLQPLTADSANLAWVGSGAKSLNFGTDDNILGKPESVYDRARKQGEKAEEDLRRIQGEAAKAEAQKWTGLFEFLNKIFSTMAGAMGSPSIGGTATTAPAPAAG